MKTKPIDHCCYRLNGLKKATMKIDRTRLCRKNSELMAKIIDGKRISIEIQSDLKDEIEKWKKQTNVQPSLATILVGSDPASAVYIAKKVEAAEAVGIKSRKIQLPDTISEADLIVEINNLNNDPSVHGILVQLPVPEHISERKICNAVHPLKDVDGFHIDNMGRLCLNMDTFVPCTVMAVIELLKRSNIETFGKNVVICGRSKNIGLPLSMILHSDANNAFEGMEATVTLCHRNTPPEQLYAFTKSADIVISATGVVGLIKPEMVKPGACVIDVGITRITSPEGKTKIVGDVDFEGVKKVAGHITPVPGGVGPMTVAMLMKNTFTAAKKQLTNNNQTL